MGVALEVTLTVSLAYSDVQSVINEIQQLLNKSASENKEIGIILAGMQTEYISFLHSPSERAYVVNNTMKVLMAFEGDSRAHFYDVTWLEDAETFLLSRNDVNVHVDDDLTLVLSDHTGKDLKPAKTAQGDKVWKYLENEYPERFKRTKSTIPATACTNK